MLRNLVHLETESSARKVVGLWIDFPSECGNQYSNLISPTDHEAMNPPVGRQKIAEWCEASFETFPVLFYIYRSVTIQSESLNLDNDRSRWLARVLNEHQSVIEQKLHRISPDVPSIIYVVVLADTPYRVCPNSELTVRLRDAYDGSYEYSVNIEKAVDKLPSGLSALEARKSTYEISLANAERILRARISRRSNGAPLSGALRQHVEQLHRVISDGLPTSLKAIFTIEAFSNLPFTQFEELRLRPDSRPTCLINFFVNSKSLRESPLKWAKAFRNCFGDPNSGSRTNSILNCLVYDLDREQREALVNDYSLGCAFEISAHLANARKILNICAHIDQYNLNLYIAPSTVAGLIEQELFALQRNIELWG